MVHDTGDELNRCDILISDRERQNRQCNHRNNSGEMIGCQAAYAIFYYCADYRMYIHCNIFNPLVLRGIEQKNPHG